MEIVHANLFGDGGGGGDDAKAAGIAADDGEGAGEGLLLGAIKVEVFEEWRGSLFFPVVHVSLSLC